MKDFRPFELRRSLQIWNLSLAIFSGVGALITGKAIFQEVLNHGLTESYCKKGDFWHGLSGYWTFLFCYSKILELGDTFFIVLRKKPLIFLHWYHHIATLNYAFLTYIDGTAYNPYIIFINFFVHSIMYFYYFLAACKIRVPPIVSQIITTLQISQFIITTLILCHVGYLILIGYPCEVTALSYFYCLFMEISYVYLFAKLFHESYVKNGGKKFKQN
uniref:Elongation of very long chain fatty acids protein n=1 Tax=Panagrolaimus superbus TaxID=310955 RepID=A0A914YA90_9BILA